MALTEKIVLRLTKDDAARLDAMAKEGGFVSRAALALSFIESILEDDAKAHGTSRKEAIR